jgi:hypothetical protein
MKYEEILDIIKGRNVNFCTVSDFELSDEKPNVFIRHDANENPYVINEMQKKEYYNDIVSTSYIFWNSPHSFTYPLDLNIPLFKRSEKRFGFEIGYYAWVSPEMSDMEAMSYIRDQINKLNDFFDIKSYACSDINMRNMIGKYMINTGMNNYLTKLSSTNKMKGHMSDSDDGFDFLVSEDHDITVVDEMITEEEKIMWFMETMIDGYVYGIRLIGDYWGKDLLRNFN